MTSYTGGCQCGAVRYAFEGPAAHVSVCHCRMCQKAVGGPFIVLVSVPIAAFRWTKAPPASFRSSSTFAREFCPACGTPLTYRKLAGEKYANLTVGSLDDPTAFPPTAQFGRESRLAWVNDLPNLAGATTTEEDFAVRSEPPPENYQHPDHD